MVILYYFILFIIFIILFFIIYIIFLMIFYYLWYLFIYDMLLYYCIYIYTCILTKITKKTYNFAAEVLHLKIELNQADSNWVCDL